MPDLIEITDEERCPTCGSDDPGKPGNDPANRGWELKVGIVPGAGWKPCPDPFHDDARLREVERILIEDDDVLRKELRDPEFRRLWLFRLNAELIELRHRVQRTLDLLPDAAELSPEQRGLVEGLRAPSEVERELQKCKRRRESWRALASKYKQRLDIAHTRCDAALSELARTRRHLTTLRDAVEEVLERWDDSEVSEAPEAIYRRLRCALASLDEQEAE